MQFKDSLATVTANANAKVNAKKPKPENLLGVKLHKELYINVPKENQEKYVYV